jgi:heat shock protein HslJ
MWRSAARVLAAAALAAGLAACTGMNAGADAGPLAGSAWILAGLPGRAPVPGATVTLAFDATTATGTDGCNRYAAPYTQQGGRLDIDGRAAGTLMACPTQVMEQARAYLAALARVGGFRRDAAGLALVAADGELLARFTAQPVDLAGTAWRVTGYNNGRQAVVSTLGGSELTLAFGTDGRASGSAGCNRWSAPYTAGTGTVAFGAAGATKRFCAELAGVMEQEQAFLAALATVATARREGDRLELRTAAGALAVGLSLTP